MIDHGPGVEEAARAGGDATPEQIAGAVRDHRQARQSGSVSLDALVLSAVDWNAIYRAEAAGAIVESVVTAVCGHRREYRAPTGVVIPAADIRAGAVFRYAGTTVTAQEIDPGRPSEPRRVFGRRHDTGQEGWITFYERSHVELAEDEGR